MHCCSFVCLTGQSGPSACGHVANNDNDDNDIPECQYYVLHWTNIASVISSFWPLSAFWGAEGAPILFSVLGFSMASCS